MWETFASHLTSPAPSETDWADLMRSEQGTQITRDTIERGTYQDVAWAGGGALRLQGGTYHTDKTENKFSEFARTADYWWDSGRETGYGHANIDRTDDITTTTIDGGYGFFADEAWETAELTRDYTVRGSYEEYERFGEPDRLFDTEARDTSKLHVHTDKDGTTGT